MWSTFPATLRFVAYDSSAAQAALARIATLYASLGVPLMERPDDLFWPAEAFFNSNYHPTAEATAARSRALAERICAQLGPRCPKAS